MKLSKPKLDNFKKSFLKVALIIYGILFFYMFTHWGNHGFGDSARIPLKNGLSIKNINWNNVAYIENIKPKNGKELETSNFLLEDDYLIGNLNNNFYDYPNRFFVLNIKSKELVEFENESAFNSYLKKNNLPNSDKMLSFSENYHKYWSKWRLWLLP